MRLVSLLVILCAACSDGELTYETNTDDEGGGRFEMTLEGASVHLREYRAGSEPAS